MFRQGEAVAADGIAVGDVFRRPCRGAESLDIGFPVALATG